MRIFAREWVSTLLQRLGMEEGVPIEGRMISSRIEAAQKAVETQNFESRKHVLEYDDVMNKQREAVYGLRRQLMEGVDQKQLITDDYLSTILSNILDENAPEKAHADEWKIEPLFAQVYDLFGAHLENEIDATQLNRHELGEAIFEKLRARYDIKEQILGAQQMRYHERIVMLSVLDGLWKDHLLAMDHLKEGIGLRGYAQQDPLVAYKKESFEMFEGMMLRFQEDTARHLFRMQIIGPDGTPIETADQLAHAQAQVAAAAAQQQLAGNPPNALPSSATPHKHPQRQPAPVSNRAPSTTIDALEREFQKKKQRELEQARAVGSPSADTNGNAPRRSRRKSRPQRPVPLRLRQEVQKVPRRRRLEAASQPVSQLGKSAKTKTRRGQLLSTGYFADSLLSTSPDHPAAASPSSPASSLPRHRPSSTPPAPAF